MLLKTDTTDETIKLFIEQYIQLSPGYITHASTIRDAYMQFARTSKGKIKLYKAIANLGNESYKHGDYFRNIKIRIIHLASPEEEAKYAHERSLQRIKCENEYNIKKLELEYEAEKSRNEMKMRQLDLELAKVKLETAKLSLTNVQTNNVEIINEQKTIPKLESLTPPTTIGSVPIKQTKDFEQQQVNPITIDNNEEFVQQEIQPNNTKSYDSDYDSDEDLESFCRQPKKDSPFSKIVINPNEPYADIKREIFDAESDDETDDESETPSVSWRETYINRPLTDEDFNYKETYRQMMDKIRSSYETKTPNVPDC